MFKKFLASLTMAAAVGSLAAAPVCAADSPRTNLTMYEAPDPTYTITIPETVAISTTDTTLVPITASDVSNLPDGKQISVTYESGNGVYGRLYLQGTDPNDGTSYVMTMMIAGTAGDFRMGALEKQIKGMELASFTDNGTENFQLYPAAFDYPDGTGNLQIHKGVPYTGYMTYGIALTDTPSSGK